MTVLETNPSDAFANDRKHVFHSWSAQGALNPAVVTRAEGSYFWTQDGTKYLDFSSQLVNVNIGHQHPKLVAAIQEQAARLCTIAPFHANDARSEAARLISEAANVGLADGDLNMVFFTNGGAEATENAVRMARLHTGRFKVLNHYRSYHGATNGAITLTGDPRRWPSEPGMPGVVKFWGPYAYRSSFHSENEAQECERALQHLDEVLMVEGAHTVAAIIVESVVGTNGILVPPDGYLAGIRDLCDRSLVGWSGFLNFATASAMTWSSRSWRAVLLGIMIASRIGCATMAFTWAASAGSIGSALTSRFLFPTFFASSSILATIFLISACASSSAWSIVASDNSLAPASTIMTASAVPATTRCNSLLSIVSKSGLTTNCPFTRPILTPATGPWKGMFEIASAADAAVMPTTSDDPVLSTESTDAITCVSK